MGASVSTAESFPFCGSDATTLCYEKCRLEELDFSAYESAGSVFADTLESCPNLRDIDVQLFHFVTTQNVVFVRWLLLLGADPMACDANGTSVLHAACRCGSVTIVKDLIVFVGTKCASTSAATITRAPTTTSSSTAGVALGTKVQHAFVNRRDNFGWTPLHVACSVSRGSVIRELIRAGADAHVQTLRGETALDMALDGHTRKALLDQYMRDHFGDVGDVGLGFRGVGASSSGQQKQFVVVNEGNHSYPAAVDEYPGEAVMKNNSDASEDFYGQRSSIPVSVPDGGSENIPTEGSADYPPSSAGTVSRAKKPDVTPRSGGQIRTNRSVAPAENTGISPGDDTERTMSMRSGRTNLNPPEVIDSAVRYEPFFVPRKPVLNANSAASLHSERGGATAAAATKRAQQLAELGIFFFNKSPGVGLAFLVATACCQDFPLALSLFLKRNSMHPSKTGEFLAESFSLSQVLRVEFLNSLRFAPCGVCGTLQRLLKQLHIPPDLKCIDRMLADTAMVWWRQCERKYRNNASFKNAPRREGAQEIEANLLFAKLKCYETLHMLLCNALLLHFHVHGKRDTSTAGINVMGKTSSGRPFVVSLQQWLALNTGIEDTYGDVDAIGGDVPRDVLTDVYRMVTAEPIQEITDGVVLTTNDQSVMQVLNAFATSTATADKRPPGGKILQPPPGNVFAATLSLHFCDGNFYPVPLGKLVRRLTGNRGHCTVFDHDEEFASQILHQEEGAAADPDDFFNYSQNPGGERVPRKFDINYATPTSSSAGALFSATAAQDQDLGTGTTRTAFSSAGDDQLSTRRSSVASLASGRKSSYANLGALLAENVTASSRGNSPVKNTSSPYKQSSGRAPPPSAGALFPTPVKSIFDVDPSMPTASTQQKQNEAIQAEQMTTGKNEVAHSLEDMLAGWAATESERQQGDDPDEDVDEVVAAVAPGEATSAWANIPVLAPGARTRYRSFASGGDGIVASVMVPAPGTTTQLRKANKMKVVRRSGDGFESHQGPTEVLATRTSPDGSYKYDYGAPSYSYLGAQQAAARGQDRQRIELSFAHSNDEEIVRVDSFSTKNASGDEACEGSSSYLRHHAENMDCFAFLCCGLLFLSTDETAAPFAFVNLRYVNYNTGARVVAAISTDFGKAPEQEVPRKIMRTSATSSASSSLTSTGSSSNITVFLENPSTKQRSENVELVLLFPDGRWESVDTPVLHLAFGDKLVRDAWMHRINTALADREPHA